MKYYLAESSQNTFVLIDCLHQEHVDPSFLEHVHKVLIQEDRDDALILLSGKEQDGAFHCSFLLLGQDGLLGDFCGNGAKAIAAYVFTKYPFCTEVYLESKRGKLLLTKKAEGIYSVVLPLPSLKIDPTFITDENRFQKLYPNLAFVNMIEPHLILEKDLSDDELLILGRTLNQDKELFPHGINVNASHRISPGKFHVKTYERGVQRLTKSCGSGSLSAAYYFGETGMIQVTTPGGDLEICLHSGGIELIGPAIIS